MENLHFSRDALLTLLETPRRLINSFFPPEVERKPGERVLEWASRCSERHTMHELIISLRGEAFMGFHGQAYGFLPGDAIFIGAGEEHGYPYPHFYPDVDHLIVKITGNAILFRNYSCRKGKELPQKPSTQLEGGSAIVGLLEECLGRIRRKPELPWRFQRHQLLEILGFMLGEIAVQGFMPGGPEGAGKRSAQERMVATVQEHIRDTAGRGISLDGLASLTGYSKHHLLRLFKSNTGRTIHEFVDAVRMPRVRERMEQGCSKKEISAELGFSCPAAFSRWLRART